MGESVPLLGIHLTAVSFPVDQLTLKLITMTSEYQQVRASCAHIKATDKKFAA